MGEFHIKMKGESYSGSRSSSLLLPPSFPLEPLTHSPANALQVSPVLRGCVPGTSTRLDDTL